MKNSFVLFVAITLLLSACQVQVTSTQPPASAQPAAQESGATADITVDYSALGQNLILETVAAQAASANDPWWAGAPQYRLLTLQGYPITNHQSKPQIFIYPAGDLASVNENMGKVAAELQSLLQTQQAGNPLPFLPLIYTFQGLTSGGKYYVAAVLPVTHPELPNDPTVNEQLTGVGSDYQKYMSRTASLLNEEPASSFTPDLSKLDALIHSLEVK